MTAHLRGQWRQVIAVRDGDERAFGEYTLRYHQEDQGERKPRHVITVHHPNPGTPAWASPFDRDDPTKVGELNWYGTTGTIHNIDVAPGHLRKGLATAMWNWGQEMHPKPKHSADRTEMGDAWARSVGGPLPRRMASEWQPPPSTLPNGHEVSAWGDVVPGGYNESLRAFDPKTGEESARFETQTARGDPVHGVAWMETHPGYKGQGIMHHLVDHYRRHYLQSGERLDWGYRTDEGSRWIKQYGEGNVHHLAARHLGFRYQPEPDAPEEGEFERAPDPSGFYPEGIAVRWRQAHHKLLQSALSRWKGDPVDMSIHMRHEQEDAPLKGGNLSTRAEAGALLHELGHNSKTFNRPLYRGQNMDRSRIPQVGDVIDHTTRPRGYSTNQSTARSFAKKGDGVPVVFASRPGARGLRIKDYVHHYGIDQYEQEHIITGRHRVVQVDHQGPHTLVHTEPIE